MTTELPEEKPAGVDWSEVHRRMATIQATLDQSRAATAKETKAILRQRAKELASESGLEAKTGESLEVVTFLLADEKYGIESRYVREVYGLKELTPVPCTPAFVLGITNFRGKLISVIDIKKFFDLPPKGLNELDKIIVVEFNQIEVGIRADAILGIQSVGLRELQPVLPTLTGVRDKYLIGVTPDRLVVLDITKFLADPDIIVNEEVEG